MNYPRPIFWVLLGLLSLAGYADASPAWVYQAAMPGPQTSPGYAALDGFVYAIGGWDANHLCSYLNTNQAFNPATNSWSARASMPTPRENTKIGVWGGKLYAVGGSTGCGPLTGANEVYNPATNTWASLAPMTARTGHGVAVIDGILYAVGGSNNGRLVEAYDISRNTWTTRASLLKSRNGLVLAAVNGLLYAFGGTDYTASPIAQNTSVEVYDPAKNQWTLSSTSIPDTRTGMAVAVMNGVIYLIGGYKDQPLTSVLAYEPVSNTWSNSPSLNTGRVTAGAAAVDNVLYAFAGYTGEAYMSSSHFNTLEALSTADAPGFGFTIGDLGGHWMGVASPPANLTTGYARLAPGAGTNAPSGLVIFGERRDGVLVSETSVSAQPLIRSGRMYAEINGPLNTGIAIANTNDQSVSIAFSFYDALAGRIVQSGNTTIGARKQIAAMLTADPFLGPSSIQGVFTFTASSPVSAFGLRGLVNERFDFLMTTIPVAEVPTTVNEPLYIAQFADGGGLTTELILVNPTDAAISGRVRWTNALGNPVSVNLSSPFCSPSCSGPEFPYTLAAGSGMQVRTTGASAASLTGRIEIRPDAGKAAPSAAGVFSYKPQTVTVTETGAEAMRAGGAYRMYAELSSSVQTGIAIASAGPAMTVQLSLTSLSGTPVGTTATLSIPANGQAAAFINQMPGFERLRRPFKGVLRISGPCCFAVFGIRSRYNEIGDFLMATTPPVPESAAASSAELVFPQLVAGGGYSTEFIFFSGTRQQSGSGALRLFNPSGFSLNFTLNQQPNTTMIGAGGGTAAFGSGDQMSISATTFSKSTGVTVQTFERDDAEFDLGYKLANYGLQFVRGFDVDTAGAGFPIPGELTFGNSTSIPANAFLVLAEVVPDITGDGKNDLAVVDLAAATDSSIVSYTTAPVAGIRSDGRFVLLQSNRPLQIVTGTVMNSTGALAAGAVVSSIEVPVLVAIADRVGNFALPVLRELTTFRLAANTPTLSELGLLTVNSSPASGVFPTVTGQKPVPASLPPRALGTFPLAHPDRFRQNLDPVVCKAAPDELAKLFKDYLEKYSKVASFVQSNGFVGVTPSSLSLSLEKPSDTVRGELGPFVTEELRREMAKRTEMALTMTGGVRYTIRIARLTARKIISRPIEAPNVAGIVRTVPNVDTGGVFTAAIYAVNNGATSVAWGPAAVTVTTDVGFTAERDGYDACQEEEVMDGVKQDLEVSTSQGNAIFFGPLAVEVKDFAAKLRVTKQGAGQGAVTSVPAGIDCGPNCLGTDHFFTPNTQVTLTAAASSGSKFDGWDGACTNAAGNCVLTMNSDKDVTARFSSTVSYTGTFSNAAFDSFPEPVSGCTFLPRISGTVNLTLTTNSNGTITGSASVPSSVSIPALSSTVGNNRCDSGSSAPRPDGSVSGTDANLSGNLSDHAADRPYTISLSGSRNGDTVTVTLTISRIFQSVNNGSVTGSYSRTVTVRDIQLRRQ